LLVPQLFAPFQRHLEQPHTPGTLPLGGGFFFFFVVVVVVVFGSFGSFGSFGFLRFEGRFFFAGIGSEDPLAGAGGSTTGARECVTSRCTCG
jgi:hypothetical protein